MKNYQCKKWNVLYNSEDERAVSEIAEKANVDRIIAVLLVNRGYKSADQAISFLKKNNGVMHDPFMLNDMDKAVSRIGKAIADNEKMTVFGDYDVDGITSVCLLLKYIRSRKGNADYYIPSRKAEGYGVSKEAIKYICESGSKLIITVDTGITATEEVEYAKKLGIDIIITDHHQCPEILPDAEAIINPKRKDSNYPFSDLAGVGVAFKLLCAMEISFSKMPPIDCVRRISYDYSDLTAIGTIADVMPVIDENRLIISLGLELINNTKNKGLHSLLLYCQNNDGKQNSNVIKRVKSGFIGFNVAPRINAAGRLSDANISVKLFLSENEKEADKLANQLCELNRERQIEENRIIEEAKIKINELSETDAPVIVLDSEKWNHGVIGIVSSRITEKYSVPSILISFEGNEDPNDGEAIGKGSGRSIKGINLFEALSACSDLLEKFGGHELAAGLSVRRKNLPEFRKRLNEYVRENFRITDLTPSLDIDCEIEYDSISLELANQIGMLEPFGIQNKMPLFIMKDLNISGINPIGQGRHLKMELSKNGSVFTAMMFGTTEESIGFCENDKVDIVFSVDVNEFRGNTSVQLIIKDIRKSDKQLQKEIESEKKYNEIINGKSTLYYGDFFPEINDFRIIYKYLTNKFRCGYKCVTYERAERELSQIEASLSFYKICIAMDVFSEMGIIEAEKHDQSFYFKPSDIHEKKDIEKSEILNRLKRMYEIG